MIKKLIQTLGSLKLLYFTVKYVVESSTYNVSQFIKLKLQITGKLNLLNICTYGLECNFLKLRWWSNKTVRPINGFRIFDKLSEKSFANEDRVIRSFFSNILIREKSVRPLYLTVLEYSINIIRE